MREIDFMSSLHKSTKRNYLERVNDKEFPKSKAATLAKKFDFEYWDGDRRINYGGYKYIPGRWAIVAQEMITTYNLKSNAKILDIGCGKGFLLYEFRKLLPECEIFGIDISEYAVNNSHEKVRENLTVGSACNLPFNSKTFDLVISINTLHNLYCFDLFSALKEIERVAKINKYVCVESYRNEEEKANLLYWQVTCEAFNNPKEWEWWFNQSGYTGDYSYIYFS